MSDEAFFIFCMAIILIIPALLYFSLRRLEKRLRAKIADEIKSGSTSSCASNR
jgi:hypothetical protein